MEVQEGAKTTAGEGSGSALGRPASYSVQPASPAQIDFPGVHEVARPGWGKLQYRWRVDDFWQLRALASSDALEGHGGGLICSQRFGDARRGMWQLKLYPYGDKSVHGKGNISLFLNLDVESVESRCRYAVFSCHLANEEGIKIHDTRRSFTRQRFCQGSEAWGWSHFMTVDQDFNKFLVPSTQGLILVCEIEVYIGLLIAPGPNLRQPDSWEADLKRYLNCATKYDTTITVNEEHTYRTNKIVLAARSGWFAKVLSDFAQKGSPAPGAHGHLSVPAVGAQGRKKPGPGVVAPQNMTIDLPPTTATPVVSAAGGASSGMVTPVAAEPVQRPGSVEGAPPTPRSGFDKRDFEPLVLSIVARAPNDLHIALTRVRPQIMANCIAFIHNDDCEMVSEPATVSELQELLVVAHVLQIQALVDTMSRRLALVVGSEFEAEVVLEVARALDLHGLADHCRSLILFCSRQPTHKDRLKALLPNPLTDNQAPGSTHIDEHTAPPVR